MDVVREHRVESVTIGVMVGMVTGILIGLAVFFITKEVIALPAGVLFGMIVGSFLGWHSEFLIKRSLKHSMHLFQKLIQEHPKESEKEKIENYKNLLAAQSKLEKLPSEQRKRLAHYEEQLARVQKALESLK